MQENLNPKVSIVIPIYGVEKYILTCLRSIEDQTYQNIECILVNDCTKDNSILIINEFLKKESNKPYIYRLINHKCNMGLSAARNTGTKYASGDYIFFLDSDDYITNYCIEEMINLAIKFNVDIVWGGIDRIYNNKHFFRKIESENRIYNRNDILKMYASQILYTESVNKLIKTTYLKENNIEFIKGILHEDVNWTFNLLAHQFNGAILDKPTYAYIQRDGSIMSKLSKKNYYAQIENIKIINSLIKTYKLSNDIDYINYFEYMIEYSIWMLFYRKSSYCERYDLYLKLRATNTNFIDILTKAHKKIGFSNYHFRLNNYKIAYVFFELQNIIRRIKGRIKI